MEQVSLDSPTGAVLNAYVCAPTAPVRAIVQINHGLAEHSHRYGRFMAALSAAGIAAVAHDHRGHGATRASDAPAGTFAEQHGCRKLLEDTVFVQEWAKGRWPGAPLVSFGHSMGGLVALNAAVTCPDHCDGLAVWNANAVPGFLGRIAQLILSAERAFSSPLSPSKIVTGLSFGAWDKIYAEEGGAFHWLSREPEEVAAYVDDPRCGFDPTISMWADVLTLARIGEDRKALRQLRPKMPIHIVGGGGDPATRFGEAGTELAKRCQNAGSTDVTVKVYENARHETLNDLDREQATADFISWLNESGFL